MHALVTGCAGFVGSTLVDRLLREGHDVVGIDNFSTGREEFLNEASRSARFRLIRGDVLDEARLAEGLQGVDTVFHMSANADVRFGTSHPLLDFEQNTKTTLKILEAMRERSLGRIVFASTGSVYGESSIVPTPEDAPMPLQTSLYGASKLAAEGFIEAYCEGFEMQAFIFRFVSLLGERYTHGHVVDFYRQLQEHPERLRVLGDGHQRKSYLLVDECIDAIMHALAVASDRLNVFNLGTDEYCEVRDSIEWICESLGVCPQLEFAGGRQGWVGDNPFIFLDCRRIHEIGWRPRVSIREAVKRTVRYLQREELERA